MCRRRAYALAALVSWFPLACTARGGAPPVHADDASLERQVTLVTDSLIAAATRADADRVFAYYEPGLHADDGVLAPLDSLEARYRAIYATLRGVDFTMARRDVRRLGPDLALVVSEGSSVARTRDGALQHAHGAWTMLWRRQGDRWRLLHIHQSFAPAATAMAGPATTSADAREIARQSERHNAAWRLNNADSVAAVYAADAILMFPDAPDARGRAAIRQMLSGMFDSTRVESLEVRPDTIEVYGSSAMEWGTYREAVKPRSQPGIRFEGRYVINWQRQPDGQWAIRRFTGNTVRVSPM